MTDGVRQLLARYQIQSTVQGRIKELYSLYCKMCRRGCQPEAVLDRIGLRIIVTSVPDCCRVLGLMHLYLHPIPGSFDDFIGASKPNGYRWLHTCAWLSDRQPIEIQIRTREMHEQADYGSAAHWWYKHAEDPFLGAASSES